MRAFDHDHQRDENNCEHPQSGDKKHVWKSFVRLVVRRIALQTGMASKVNDLMVILAEGVGFEPTVPLQARRFSRPVP
jgi:hypothetical protein